MTRLLIALLHVIDFIEGVPYAVSYYSWLAYHGTIGRVVLMVQIWHLHQVQKQARKANPYYRDTASKADKEEQPTKGYAMSE